MTTITDHYILTSCKDHSLHYFTNIVYQTKTEKIKTNIKEQHKSTRKRKQFGDRLEAVLAFLDGIITLGLLATEEDPEEPAFRTLLTLHKR